MPAGDRILILWNQTEDDIYEAWRDQGKQTLDWDPEREVPDVGTVAEETAAFVRALRNGGYRVDIVNVEDDVERIAAAVHLHRPDAVFNLVEYFNDDSTHETFVAGMFELLGVPYTGNPPLTLATCQDKYRTKVILEAAGLPTSPYFMVKPQEPIPTPDVHELDFPVIVKPAWEDASGGIEADSVVHSQEALEARIRFVMKDYEMPVLVEEYIDGREIHAAVLGKPVPEILPLFEMEFDDSEFNPDDEWRPQIISFRAKWDPHSKDFYTMDSVCPAEDLDPETEDYIRKVAREAFQAMGCRDYARIDMRYDEEDDEVYILEVNPNPDLVDGAAYIQCATAGGRTYSQTLAEIAEMALARGRRAKKKAETVPVEKAGLPSDQLMREFEMRKRGLEVPPLPQANPAPAELSRDDDAWPFEDHGEDNSEEATEAFGTEGVQTLDSNEMPASGDTVAASDVAGSAGAASTMPAPERGDMARSSEFVGTGDTQPQDDHADPELTRLASH